MPYDPRDDAMIKAAAAAVAGMIAAVHRDDPESATRELAKLLTAIMEHKRAMLERSDDAALLRAVELAGR